MATANMYALSLRSDGRVPEKTHGDGVPFFVPQLAKVKTNIMCQTNNKHLLFSYEKAGANGDFGSGGSGGPASPTLPYRKQGDRSYYTEENLKKRQRLMEDKKVLAAIARFWDTFPNIRQGQSAIDQRDYVDVFMKFYKALVAPHEFSIGEARKIVERDWGRDVGDSDAMSKALFFRSLFEVADIWTIGISADEYVSFLSKLFNRVTMKIQDQKTSLWVTVFAELDKIRSFSEPKDSVATVATAALAAGMTVTATNQDHDQSSSSPDSGPDPTSSGGAPSASKPRPPLLKKKTLSSDAMLAGDVAAMPTTGISFRRLPEISATTATPAAQSFAAGEPASPGEPQSKTSMTKSELQGQQTYRLSEASSSDAGANPRSPNPKLALSVSSENNNINSGGSNDGSSSSTATSAGPSTYRQSRFARTGSLKAELSSPSRRSAQGDTAKDAGSNASRPTAADLPPQPVRLAMPSIYLSPDLTESQATYRAARRRIRESSKLAQRLRRITF